MATQYACETLISIDDVENACECDLPDDLDVINNVLDGASDFLSLLAGVPLGRCTAAYRPCRREWCDSSYRCGCCALKGIHLPGIDPTVTAVKIDGATVATTEYKVVITSTGVHVLERFDSEYHSVWWPTRQKILAPSTAADTFEVTVESGVEVNMSMKLAVTEVACDVFKAIAGLDHVLPQGTVSAMMQGVRIDFRRFSDPTEQATMDLAGLGWTNRYLATMPTDIGTQILSPELDSGWELYQLA